MTTPQIQPQPIAEGPTIVPRTTSNFVLFREWTRLEGVSQRSLCARGSVIYSPGEPADSVFLLKSGKVKILRLGPDGKRLIAHLVGPGEIFGEMALLGETYRENAAEVLEDATVWVIPCKSVLDWLRPRPQAWHELTLLFGKRLRFLEGAVERLLFGEVEERAIRLLLELAKQYGEPAPDGINLRIELSQKEFAHLIASTRETTSSVLNQLAKRGLIRIRRRRLAICSMEALTQAVRRSLPGKVPLRSEGVPKPVLAAREA